MNKPELDIVTLRPQDFRSAFNSIRIRAHEAINLVQRVSESMGVDSMLELSPHGEKFHRFPLETGNLEFDWKNGIVRYESQDFSVQLSKVDGLSQGVSKVTFKGRNGALTIRQNGEIDLHARDGKDVEITLKNYELAVQDGSTIIVSDTANSKSIVRVNSMGNIIFDSRSKVQRIVEEPEDFEESDLEEEEVA